MGQTALLPFRRKACWGFFFALKNPTASAGFEFANLGTKGSLGVTVDRNGLLARVYNVPSFRAQSLWYPSFSLLATPTAAPLFLISPTVLTPHLAGTALIKYARNKVVKKFITNTTPLVSNYFSLLGPKLIESDASFSRVPQFFHECCVLQPITE